MKELRQEDKVLVFTRIPEDGFDEFMGNPEAVIATVEDMGFEKDEMLAAMSTGDPAKLMQLMEGRWSGERMNFGFENYWQYLTEKFPGHEIFKMIMEEGRHSQIHTYYGEIRVLSQNQVVKADEILSMLELVHLSPDDEADIMLESFFPALQKFFSYAREANEFVLVSHI